MIAELAMGRAAEHRDRVRAEPARTELGDREVAVPRSRRASVTERRGRERRLHLVGLTLSVAFHAVVILTVSVRPLEWAVRSESRAPEVIQLPVLQAVELAPSQPTPRPQPVQEEATPVLAATPADRAIPVIAAAALPVLQVEEVRNPVTTGPPILPVAVSTEDAAERGRYEQEVARWVERQRSYPLAARQRRLEGTAIVRIQVDGNGALLDAQLVRDTGHAVLDRAALDMIHRAAPYPSVPRSLTSAPVEVLVPIQFTLAR